MEADDHSRNVQEDKNGVRSATSPSDNSDVFYIPLGGQDGELPSSLSFNVGELNAYTPFKFVCVEHRQ